MGEEFEECDSLPPVPPPDVCGLPKDRGPERNFTVRWFFDMEYGGCAKYVVPFVLFLNIFGIWHELLHSPVSAKTCSVKKKE